MKDAKDPFSADTRIGMSGWGSANDDDIKDPFAAGSKIGLSGWEAPVERSRAAASMVALQPGAVLAGRYEIVALLGQGGMGAVFKAHDRELDRFVALKTVHPEMVSNSEVLQRFKQELILARKITHKNVIRIYDLGEDQGIKFITMDFIEGQDLASIMKEHGRLSPQESAEIMDQVCHALEAAHEEGVIHRDLKPQNIMRDKKGRILVMDFGLARSTEMAGMTQSGAMVGTMEYMSPEQASGKHLDARSDIFAVGLIFYELLVGEPAFKADSAFASLVKRTRERAKPPSSINSTIPRALNEVVVKCLEREPQDRYQSISEVVADLEAWKSGSKPVSSKGGLTRALRALKHREIPWREAAIVAVLVAALAIAGVVYLRPRPKATAAPQAVSVLVGDFTNHTGDPVFNGTLEPMFNVALEGASFVNAFNRGQARKLAQKLPNPTDKLDEQAARLVAVSQGIGAVVTGALSRRGDGYKVSVEALDARTGNSLGSAEITAQKKDELLAAIPKLAAPIRKALGDTTPESLQLENAGGAFTAASLEVVHQHAIAMEQQFAGRLEEALQSFSKAAELDPSFGRAYGGMAAVSIKMGKLQDVEKYMKLTMAHVDRMADRERYRSYGFYYLTTGNFQKCVEEYTELVARYPADNIAHNNLAVCFSALRNLPKAIEEARRGFETIPDTAALANLSLFSSYGGDFQSGEREARRLQSLNPAFEYGYLALAFAQLGQGQMPQATETYQKIGKLSILGASMAAAGVADLALYEARFSDGIRGLEQGAAEDLAASRPDSAANKFATIAYTYLWTQHSQKALAFVRKALVHSQTLRIRFLAAQAFVDAGQTGKAQKLAGGLASEVPAEPQAYAKIIEGKLALKRGDARQAIKLITDANSMLDTWIGRFELGRAYLQAGLFVEADSEFDRCIKRRGEALALFLDEVPTYGYFPQVYYYQGRVREGLKSPGFVESYRNYLSIRGQAGEDPLLPEIRRRIGQ